MREICSYGSVGEPPGNRWLYLDKFEEFENQNPFAMAHRCILPMPNGTSYWESLSHKRFVCHLDRRFCFQNRSKIPRNTQVQISSASVKPEPLGPGTSLLTRTPGQRYRPRLATGIAFLNSDSFQWQDWDTVDNQNHTNDSFVISTEDFASKIEAETAKAFAAPQQVSNRSPQGQVHRY